MSNTWERAFNSIDPAEHDELKQKQRKIQQKDWDKEFLNTISGMTDEEQIVKLLQDNNLYREGHSLGVNITELVSKYNHMLKQVNKMKDAFKG